MYTLKRLVRMSTHMVFIQIGGLHQLVAFQTTQIQCYPASSEGDTMVISQGLLTRASLTFLTRSLCPLAIVISILHPGAAARAVTCLAPGTLPKRTLQSIHLICQHSVTLGVVMLMTPPYMLLPWPTLQS